MNVVALLTGRGNNTLTDKNILPVLGRPLLQYPCLAAKEASCTTHWFVSSDDSKILEAASEVGYQPIKRPIELGRPDAKHVDVMLHAVRWLRAESIEPDILIVMLANSATVLPSWMDEAVALMHKDTSITCVAPCYQDQDHHPYRARTLDREGNLTTFEDLSNKEVSSNRQELSPCFFFAHNFWVLRTVKSLDVNNGLKPWAFMGGKVHPIIVEECFDVHTLSDLERTERWLKANGSVSQ